MKATIELSNMIGDSKTACAALGVPRANFYRFKNQNTLVQQEQRPLPPLTLSEEEKSQVLSILNSERFVDQSPYEVYATLLDEGQYYCSIRTMYRISD
jgi:putative transposase